jgi:hypothetical protein
MSRHDLTKRASQSTSKGIQRQAESEEEQSLQMQRQSNLAVTPQNALQLQRLLGNAAVQRMMTPSQKSGDIQRLFGKKTSKAENAARAERVRKAVGKMEVSGSPQALNALLPFAQKEFSTENINCQLMILEYKNPTSRSREELVKTIQSTFFGADAPQQVNVPNSQIDAVAEKAAQEQYSDNLFDSISNTLAVNISDTISRVIFDESDAARVFQDYVLQAAHEKTFSFKVKNALKKGFGAFTSGVAATMKNLSGVNPLMPF